MTGESFGVFQHIAAALYAIAAGVWVAVGIQLWRLYRMWRSGW